MRIMDGGKVEAVLTLGTAASEAWQFWKATPAGQASNVAFAPITHPTQPESSSKNDKTKIAQATKKMLANWNVGAPDVVTRDHASGYARSAETLR